MALGEQDPALPHSCLRRELCKPMFGFKRPYFLYLLLYLLIFLEEPVAVELASPMCCPHPRERVSECFTQGECLMASLPCLVWIALQPQGQSRIAKTRHTSVLPGSQHLGTVSLRVVYGNPLLKDRPRCSQIPKEPEDLPSCTAGAPRCSDALVVRAGSPPYRGSARPTPGQCADGTADAYSLGAIDRLYPG